MAIGLALHKKSQVKDQLKTPTRVHHVEGRMAKLTSASSKGAFVAESWVFPLLRIGAIIFSQDPLAISIRRLDFFSCFKLLSEVCVDLGVSTKVGAPSIIEF